MIPKLLSTPRGVLIFGNCAEYGTVKTIALGKICQLPGRAIQLPPYGGAGGRLELVIQLLPYDHAFGISASAQRIRAQERIPL